MALKNTKSVNLPAEIHSLAKKTADEYGISMLEVIEKAIESHYKRFFFEGLNSDMERLKKDPKVIKVERKTRLDFGI